MGKSLKKWVEVSEIRISLPYCPCSPPSSKTALSNQLQARNELSLQPSLEHVAGICSWCQRHVLWCMMEPFPGWWSSASTTCIAARPVSRTLELLSTLGNLSRREANLSKAQAVILKGFCNCCPAALWDLAGVFLTTNDIRDSTSLQKYKKFRP